MIRLRTRPKTKEASKTTDVTNEEKKRQYSFLASVNSIKIVVLLVLCLQNSLYTILRRYSQGVLKEGYSKYEVLLGAEILKFIVSLFMVYKSLDEDVKITSRAMHLLWASRKMLLLACMYGAMNILSFVALRNIDAGTFTIFAQLKVLSTATFSAILLGRRYSYTKWRALFELMLSALLFSSHVFTDSKITKTGDENPLFGIFAVVAEVTTSGFSSIYFEKVIKTDNDNLNIWERNLQLAFGSILVYLCFIIYLGGGEIGYGGGWSNLTLLLSCCGAAGGMLVALSIKYADAILKTLATTGAIILSSLLEYVFLDGPLNQTMILAGTIVILSICNYTFDQTQEVKGEKQVITIPNEITEELIEPEKV